MPRNVDIPERKALLVSQITDVAVQPTRNV